MFEHDPLGRPRQDVRTAGFMFFKHASRLGNAHAQELFDLVSVGRTDGGDGPARAFTDYQVSIDRGKVPENVELMEML